ncbi:uncharacterized protein LOC110902140 [Helianthus annuus]|uniref:uncharacterized protein LOC110902140 n=1 Tax=Helianthus annuus TaxID=4232 RepID=UPI000B8FC2B6|nr:uncharacterized protein LOC110902140 [Helianthus annuus]
MALTRRRITIEESPCSLCGTGDEDVMHLFTGCGFSFGVWSIVGQWCNFTHILAFDFSDLLQIHEMVKGGKWAKKVIRGIIMVTCWAIWKSRNDKVFRGITPKVAEVVATVKSCSFLWLKSRSNFANIVWKDWVLNPLYML